MSDSRIKGTVSNFNRDKHFGFVRGDDHADYFFHMSALPFGLKNIDRMARITFETGVNDKGPIALRIQLLQPPN